MKSPEEVIDELARDIADGAKKLGTREAWELAVELNRHLSKLERLGRTHLAALHPAEQFHITQESTEELWHLASTTLALIPHYRQLLKDLQPLVKEARKHAH